MSRVSTTAFTPYTQTSSPIGELVSCKDGDRSAYFAFFET